MNTIRRVLWRLRRLFPLLNLLCLALLLSEVVVLGSSVTGPLWWTATISNILALLMAVYLRLDQRRQAKLEIEVLVIPFGPLEDDAKD